jgi:hypothetical protein
VDPVKRIPRSLPGILIPPLKIRGKIGNFLETGIIPGFFRGVRGGLFPTHAKMFLFKKSACLPDTSPISFRKGFLNTGSSES